MTDLTNRSEDFIAGFYAGLDDATEILRLIKEINKAMEAEEEAED